MIDYCFIFSSANHQRLAEVFLLFKPKAMQKLLIAFMILLLTLNDLAAQRYPLDNKRDYEWLIGYGYNYRRNYLKFDGSTAHPFADFTTMPYMDSYGYNNICDTSGRVLLSTNGMQIATANHQITSGNDSIGVSRGDRNGIPITYFEGYRLRQGSIILPWPDRTDRFAIIHETVEFLEPVPYEAVNSVFLSIVDMNLNNGMGDLVLNTSPIATTDNRLNSGFLAACRHANGRDWWILAPMRDTAAFIRLLLDPSGLRYLGMQKVGVPIPGIPNGNVHFSPNGEHYAFGCGSYWTQQLHIYDFDRCTGLLSNHRGRVQTDSFDVAMGAAWSPNSRFLYRNTAVKLFQIDMWDDDPIGNERFIANNDSTFETNGFPFAFNDAQLAPNGKIYIAAGLTQRLHVIENPNGIGEYCNFRQHSYQLQALNDYTVPYFPNFRLGPIDGSVCDTLGIDVVEDPPLEPDGSEGILLFPNPTTGIFQYEIAGSGKAQRIVVYDVLGRAMHVRSDVSDGWVDLSALADGVYVLEIRTADKVLGREKVVKHGD